MLPERLELALGESTVFCWRSGPAVTRPCSSGPCRLGMLLALRPGALIGRSGLACVTPFQLGQRPRKTRGGAAGSAWCFFDGRTRMLNLPLQQWQRLGCVAADSAVVRLLLPCAMRPAGGPRHAGRNWPGGASRVVQRDQCVWARPPRVVHPVGARQMAPRAALGELCLIGEPGNSNPFAASWRCWLWSWYSVVWRRLEASSVFRPGGFALAWRLGDGLLSGLSCLRSCCRACRWIPPGALRLQLNPGILFLRCSRLANVLLPRVGLPASPLAA